jgi:transcription factor E2F3
LNSLEELTKKFVECVYEENTKIINLKNVIEKIKVKKRRIYDITNVMEGN